LLPVTIVLEESFRERSLSIDPGGHVKSLCSLVQKARGVMNFAAADLHLAIAHHLLIFLLAGILAFEIGVIRLTMTGADINRVGRVDAWYGILALAIVAVGFSRAIFAAKGWGYYSINGFFWAKMAAFAAVGLLSIVPTVRIISWRRTLAKNAAFAPAAGDILKVRRFLWAEVAFFALIPACAAAMARGYGSFVH
jgi:putative membrane protein